MSHQTHGAVESYVKIYGVGENFTESGWLMTPSTVQSTKMRFRLHTQLDDASEFETSLSDDRRGLRVHIEGRHDVVQEALAED